MQFAVYFDARADKFVPSVRSYCCRRHAARELDIVPALVVADTGSFNMADTVAKLFNMDAQALGRARSVRSQDTTTQGEIR
jgi:hypothetical protein